MSRPAAACPPKRDLLRLTLGQLSDADRKRVKRHVDECPDCRFRIRQIGVEGTVFTPPPEAGTGGELPVLGECPGSRELSQFALNQLSVARADTIRRHVATCSPCQIAFKALGVQGTIFTAPPEPSAETGGDSTLLPEAMEKEETRVAPPKLQPSPSRVGVPRANTPLPNSPPTTNAPPQTSAELPAGLSLKPPQRPDELGRLGNYRILKVLGAGAAGVVFHAEDVQLRRAVALKVMKPAEKKDDDARKRFLREGRLAAGIQHETIVTIYQVGEDDGVPFLAMQLLTGETLDDRLKREGKLEVLEAMRIGRAIADGLATAHEHGLIHRDIKPANIWLDDKSNGVKIVDFGLARPLAEDTQLTRTGTIMGTPAYMSPEQARGAKVDHRSDLFSLGGVIYRMVTGRTPFQAEDTMGMMLALAHEQPRPLKAFTEGVPDPLQGLINMLLAKPPDVRPARADDVIEVIDVVIAILTAEPEEEEPEQPTNWALTVLLMLVMAGVAFALYWFGPMLLEKLRGR